MRVLPSLRFLAGLAIILGSMLPGCQCNPNIFDPPGQPPPVSGPTDLRIYLQVNAPANTPVEALDIVIDRLDLVLGASGDGVVTVANGPIEVNRVSSAFGVPLLVAVVNAPPGQLEQVRFIIAKASIRSRVVMGNSVVSEADDVKVPSGPETGIKIVMHDQVTIDPNRTVSILGTLDVTRDILDNGGQGFIFKPTIEGTLLTRPTINDQLGANDLLLNVMTRAFSATGVVLERAKVIDAVTGDIRDVVLDAATGKAASFEDALQENEAAWRHLHGALHFQLVTDLSTFRASDEVQVRVWAPFPASGAFRSTSPATWDQDHAAFMRTLQATAAPAVDRLTADLQRIRGVRIQQVEYVPPRVTITATRTAIEESVAFLADASFVTGVTQSKAAGVLSARDQIQDPLWFNHFIVGSGQFIRAAIIEGPEEVAGVFRDACIASSHPDFALVHFENTLGQSGRCTQPTPHITAVAGMLAAARPNPGGNPVFFPVGLGHGTVFEGGTLGQETLDRAPHLINYSFTTGPYDRENLDNIVYVHRMFFANAAGETEVVPSPNHECLCYSYNAVCVGGYEHNGTVGLANFGDDFISNDSLYLNDPNTGREEPKLVGSQSANVPFFQGGYAQFAGTSFSSPAVVGTAGLLMATYQADLIGDPTLLRAVLMVSAKHDIQTPEELPLCMTSPCANPAPVPIFGDGLDDRDGAGVPRGDRAKDIMDDQTFVTRKLDRNVDFDASGNLLQPLTFSATSGQVVRVGITWDQCPDNIISVADTLGVDLDLTVIGPPDANGNRRIKANPSMVDNYEMLQFVTNDSGTYTIKIKAQRWRECAVDGTGVLRTNVAVAWDVSPFIEF